MKQGETETHGAKEKKNRLFSIRQGPGDNRRREMRKYRTTAGGGKGQTCLTVPCPPSKRGGIRRKREIE